MSHRHFVRFCFILRKVLTKSKAVIKNITPRWRCTAFSRLHCFRTKWHVRQQATLLQNIRDRFICLPLCEFLNMITLVSYSTVSCALKRMINTEICLRPQNPKRNNIRFVNVSMKQKFYGGAYNFNQSGPHFFLRLGSYSSSA
jgi:hypothetical protein